MTQATAAATACVTKEDATARMVQWLGSEDLDTGLAPGLIAEVESVDGLALLDEFIVDSLLKDLGLKAVARQKFRNAYLKLVKGSPSPPPPATAAASPIIPIDKESLERVRGFRKHYELLDKAKQLAVDARDELVRIKPPLLQKIQTIASVIVDKAIEHLNMDIRAIEQHQAVSKDSEKKCMDAMQITKFSEIVEREDIIKETTDALFSGTEIKMLTTAPSVFVANAIKFEDLVRPGASTESTCILEVAAVCAVFETRTSAGFSAGPLTLVNKWVPYGGSHASPTFTKDTSGMVTVSGLVKHGGWGSIAILPDDCRPRDVLIFNLNNHDASCRVDVHPDGRIAWNAGSKAGHHWVSLDGIRFSVKDTTPLTLTNGWAAYGSGHAPPTFTKDNTSGMVTVSGLAKAGGWGDIATLPHDCRPKQILIFGLNNHDSSCRVDVHPDGRIAWNAGSKAHAWVSLDGIRFSVKDTTPLTLTNGWAAYGSGHAPPTFTKDNTSGMVTVSGLTKAGGWGDIATLPHDCRPKQILIFGLNNHDSSCRVDVHPDGRIAWNAGGKAHGFVSLDGIAFRSK